MQRRCGGSLCFLKSELVQDIEWEWGWGMYLIRVDGGIGMIAGGVCVCGDTSWSVQFKQFHLRLFGRGLIVQCDF